MNPSHLHLKPYKAATYMCFLGVLLAPMDSAFSDTWSYEQKLDEVPHEFGSLTVLKVVDARDNITYPTFMVDVKHDDELLARLRGVSFERFAVTPDDAYFIGVSNDSLPGTAYFIVDKDGNLVIEQKHESGLHYYSQSVTRVREWYDDNDPDIQFHHFEGREYRYMTYVTIRLCNGERKRLLPLSDRLFLPPQN